MSTSQRNVLAALAIVMTMTACSTAVSIGVRNDCNEDVDVRLTDNLDEVDRRPWIRLDAGDRELVGGATDTQDKVLLEVRNAEGVRQYLLPVDDIPEAASGAGYDTEVRLEGVDCSPGTSP